MDGGRVRRDDLHPVEAAVLGRSDVLEHGGAQVRRDDDLEQAELAGHREPLEGSDQTLERCLDRLHGSSPSHPAPLS
jgi:hypothetical protein